MPRTVKKAKQQQINNKTKKTQSTVSKNKPIIIHISGASGSGKTTLGNKLKTRFGNKIVVKDLDDLLDEHAREYFSKTPTHQGYTLGNINEKAYQGYINNYINKQNKPIIFVGLNDNFVDFYPKRKDIYYNIHAQYKYYIDIDDNIIVKQKCVRFLNNIHKDTNLIDKIDVKNTEFMNTLTQAINTECNATYILKWVNKWKTYYKTQDYKFLSREDIFDLVVKILTPHTK